MISDRYERMKHRAIGLLSQVESHRGTISQVEAKAEASREHLRDTQVSLDLQIRSIQVLKDLIDRMSAEHIEHVISLLTYALQTIFHDKEYSVDLVMGEKRGAKTAEFYLVEARDGHTVRTEFVDGIGGGVQVVVGFVLQLFYIQYFKLSPIMFLDESFSQLSDIYIPGMKSFLNQLSEKMNFIFVLISHDARLIPDARKNYLVNEGEVTEIDEDRALSIVSQSTIDG